MGVQTWIGRQNIHCSAIPNMFMVKPCMEKVGRNINEIHMDAKNEMQNDENEGDKITSPLLHKRKRLDANMNVCWDLATEAQLIVDNELIELDDDNITWKALTIKGMT